MRELLETKSFPLADGHPGAGTQTTLDIFAEAAVAYPAESQTNLWFDDAGP